MSLETALEWPRFCYSGPPTTFDDLVKVAPEKPSASRKRRPAQNNSSAKRYRRTTSDVHEQHALPKASPAIPEFAFSDLMRKMASKYQQCEKENAPDAGDAIGAFCQYLPFPNAFAASLLYRQASKNPLFPAPLNPFTSMQFNEEKHPIDLSPSSFKFDDNEEENVDILSVDPPSPTNVEDWPVSAVAEFVSNVESCHEYSEVFKDHSIDGSALMALSETHMTKILGMKLGPVFRLKAAITHLVRHSPSSPSSSLASD